MKKVCLVFVLFLIASCLTQTVAQLKLPAIISSNMVMQQNSIVKLWGWAKKNESITVTPSWQTETKTKADKDGYWSLEVATTENRQPHSIRFQTKGSNILLENILFGEVWLCSGQSNMQQPIKGYKGQPTFGANRAIVFAKDDQLRLFTVKRSSSKTAQDTLSLYSTWAEAHPENVANFSAVAYYFGSQLQSTLGVPVGLIHTSWGGSTIEAWMSKEAVSEIKTVDLSSIDFSKRPNKIPTALFNAMIHPIIPFRIKGVIWYQGEANRTEPELYKKLFPSMVTDWRQRWGDLEFPFYFTQIAPYTYGKSELAFNSYDNSAFMRVAQVECVDLIPNSGIAVTTDIGDPQFIHPPKKKEVADRLLYKALNQTYGFISVKGDAPRFDTLEILDNSILLKFEYAEDGLYSPDELNHFEIAGEDHVFYPAKAEIVNKNQVKVTSRYVQEPIAVRYAWSNWVKGTLFDTYLLPVSSFRTDNWDNATRGER